MDRCRKLRVPAWCLAGLLLGCAASSLHAELTWTRKTVELNPDDKTSVLEARFPFANDGATPVDIRDVETSCGCTTVALAQRHFEPGQSGEIVVRYAVGQQTGLQKKTILVSMAGNPVATALTLVVHIPELVRVQPEMVTWKEGEPNASKTITIESADPAALPLEHVVVLTSDDSVTVALEPVREGSKYQISVVPKSTGKQLYVTLTIHCRLGGEDRVFHAHAAVQPKALLESR